MTNRPESRKTHVTRIVGTNKKGEVLQDIWVDVERIDRAKSDTKSTHGFWQGVVRLFKWSDDPTQDGYEEEGTPSRKTVVVKVCSPDEEDVNDPEEWVPVRAIRYMKMRKGDHNYQESFLLDETAQSRKVEVRKIVHYDTSIDDAAQAAFDADPTLKAYVVPGADYVKKDGSDGSDTTKDAGQYVEHEIVETYKPRINALDEKVSQVNLNAQVKLLNQYLIDESDEPESKVVGNNGINPPYRLDPFQNIVNVQFVSQEAVLGIDKTPIVDDDLSMTITTISKDGTTWDEGFGKSSNAASGLGNTVVCKGRRFVAFGKTRDGGSCFITVADSGGAIERGIERGVLDDQGKLTWTPVTSVAADRVWACSFAGGAFFVSYSKDDNALLAVSFDGQTFAKGNPFPGVAEAAIGTGYDPGDRSPDPFIGSVAYDKDNSRYVVTGGYTRSYIGTFTLSGGTNFFATSDFNFMSSTSSDGRSWTPYFDRSESEGDAGTATKKTIQASKEFAATTCFGNGVFVASSAYKKRLLSTGLPIWVNKPICSVAVSSNGRDWTNIQLPDATSSLTRSGSALSVVFIKSRKVSNPDSKGFFIASGFQGDDASGVSLCMVWRSEDGVVWTKVQTLDHKYGWVLSAINKSRGTVVFK
ncbi:hypothetical protein [Bradyrhizobium sp. USDA 4502]